VPVLAVWPLTRTAPAAYRRAPNEAPGITRHRARKGKADAVECDLGASSLSPPG